MGDSHITNGEEEGDGEKISETTATARPTPPQRPLARIGPPEIVQDLQGEMAIKATYSFLNRGRIKIAGGGVARITAPPSPPEEVDGPDPFPPL